LPHICADTDIEAAREQGYQAGRDRAAQFLLIMNTARGTLHGALGNLGVDAEDDIETRVTGYSRNELNLMFQRLSAPEQAIIVAYCEGGTKR
jgi:acyl-homoserine lactone acylase PvdQ